MMAGSGPAVTSREGGEPNVRPMRRCTMTPEPLFSPVLSQLRDSMARVTVEDCVDKIPNRFDLVLLAAQRPALRAL